MNEWRQAVRRDPLGDPGPTGQPLHRAVGGVAVHPRPGGAEEDRPGGPFADVQIQSPAGTGCERDGGLFAALAHDPQRAMTAVHVQVVDADAERFADPHAVQGQQRDEGVIASRSQPGLDEQGAELVAVQAQRPRLGVDLGAPDVGGRIPGQESFEVAVAVEAAQRRQAAGHRGAHPTVRFHGAGEHPQTSAAHLQQAEPVVGAPGSEQTQIGRVADPGVAGVVGQEPDGRISFSTVERVFIADKC